MSKWSETEARLMSSTYDGPVTEESIVRDLRSLGVVSGDSLLVHAALSALGWVCGGAQAVIAALQTAVGDEGTLVMPTYTGWNTDPSSWINPPAPKEWIEDIRHAMPAYDPDRSPVKATLGVLPEYFRTLPGVERSAHPRSSFAAWGKNSRLIVSDHALDFAFGETSPLARIYDLKGRVLLMGSPFDTVCSWYLSAHRVAGKDALEETCRSCVIENGVKVWKSYRDHQRKHDDFEILGAEFEKSGRVKSGKVGNAQTRIFSQVDAVDFGLAWMQKNRG